LQKKLLVWLKEWYCTFGLPKERREAAFNTNVLDPIELIGIVQAASMVTPP